MQLSRIPKTSDQLGRYYTAQGVAGLLIQSMAIQAPQTVIELGVGDGALLREASQHWGSAKFITVDIDECAKANLPPNISSELIQHHTGDALDFALDKKLGIDFGSVDSAVCNPPYVLPRWRKHFGDILEEAGLQSILPRFGCIPAEVLFIAQNLRLLKNGGKLGLILPDGIIAGEKFSALRDALTTTHRIERVIELPRRIFQNTDAKAHIMVLSKNIVPDETIKIQKLDTCGVLSKIIELPLEQASTRLDYSYLSAVRAKSTKTTFNIREVVKLLRRGTFSSAERKTSDLTILHTTDFTTERLTVPRRFTTSKSILAKGNFVYAQKGDILIGRVGRNLNQKIWRVTTGFVLISDCVLMLRIDPIYADSVFEFLTSTDGRECLAGISHGVGASFITTDALLSLSINSKSYQRTSIR
ncbi:N-6 DNA methylase [Pseudomonas syringae]|uniref:N-6 DNA methylase n=1 Tax=Pseudomonas syringae TaxID=317 RepID=UPI00200A3544|nr:N-6 DNA methylase [Pseudomonas syringae]MCK9697102.1 SAM-dependent methyltransferase [Pseudomonas syringae pv. syringae]MCK9726441.1 SAM-dependent methyltransferase [Pseudomonas syringae pv. syringae]MDU8420762.1 N-6 DNA methylase [Pseudomonas syringae]